MAGRQKVDLSMSKYVIQILEDNVDQPESINEWLDLVKSYPPVPGPKPGEATAVIRAMRDAIYRV